MGLKSFHFIYSENLLAVVRASVWWEFLLSMGIFTRWDDGNFYRSRPKEKMGKPSSSNQNCTEGFSYSGYGLQQKRPISAFHSLMGYWNGDQSSQQQTRKNPIPCNISRPNDVSKGTQSKYQWKSQHLTCSHDLKFTGRGTEFIELYASNGRILVSPILSLSFFESKACDEIHLVENVGSRGLFDSSGIRNLRDCERQVVIQKLVS